MSYKDLKFPFGSRFLITGGAGFIGSNICEALLQMGHFVRCLDDFSGGNPENINDFLDNPLFELVEGSVCDFETCLRAAAGMDYVSHHAGWESVPRSIELPLRYGEININGTLNMLEAARRSKVKRFVYASSSAVYGDDPSLPKREDRIGRVLSPFALTKKVNEEYARLYFELYGLETVGLRYFNVFGKRQDPDGPYAAVIPRFINMLLRGEVPVINGDGWQSRDFTYVENAMEANLKALLAPKEAAGQVFNIANGSQEFLIDVYYMLCRALGKKAVLKFGPDRAGDIKHSRADIIRAKRYLGYDPGYNFADGISLTIEWYKERLKLRTDKSA